MAASTGPAMPSRTGILSLLIVSAEIAPLPALAHFQELIPSTEIVTAATGPLVRLHLSFTHPMDRGPAMSMGEPVRFGVVGPMGDEDLKPSLLPTQMGGQPGFQAEYRVKGPGDYVFYLEPAQYWEAAEGIMIVQYTKVVVNAYGAEAGWDRVLGLPVEIEPLTRPYGLWTGNLFRGLVRRGGEPVPFAEVEVEWANDGSVVPPADPFVTQVVKTDASGVFAYAMPRAGWWGFAALLRSDKPMAAPDGHEVSVEQDAVIWVRARDM